MEPAYSFKIPSIDDDTALDCRLYHPEDVSSLSTHPTISGAVLAHPYAPLGGSYDDPIVLATAHNLIKHGYVVVTFNFRGAAESQGHTSWSGHGEKQDYISIVGFLLHYLQSLREPRSHVQVILGGYSYGSLVLSKLPPLTAIESRFETAALGTSAAEVILRAQRLATDTLQVLRNGEIQSRGRNSPQSSQESSSGRSRAHSNTITIGGEETDSTHRRHSRSSRDSRLSADLIKKGADVPHRIKMHFRRPSDSSSEDVPAKSSKKTSMLAKHSVDLRYLLISPLLPPLSLALMPSLPVSQLFGGSEKDVGGFSSYEHQSLMIWGSADGFTSSKKLSASLDKLPDAAKLRLSTFEVEGAGHFWRERGVMRSLQEHIGTWISRDG